MLYLATVGSIIVLIMMGYILKKTKKDIYYIQNFDTVTGLMKEECFCEKVNKLISEEEDLHYSILSVDIDRFRYITNIYGQESGQKIIESFVEYFDKWSTCILLASRTGMDSFVLFMRTVDVDIFIEDFVIAENSITARSSRIMGANNILGYSVGIYDMRDDSKDCKTMIDCAYFARVHGHSVYGRTSSKYTYLMEQNANKINEITFQMVRAVENEEFKISYSLIGEEVLERTRTKNVRTLKDVVEKDETGKGVVASMYWDRQ